MKTEDREIMMNSNNNKNSNNNINGDNHYYYDHHPFFISHNNNNNNKNKNNMKKHIKVMLALIVVSVCIVIVGVLGIYKNMDLGHVVSDSAKKSKQKQQQWVTPSTTTTTTTTTAATTTTAGIDTGDNNLRRQEESNNHNTKFVLEDTTTDIIISNSNSNSNNSLQKKKKDNKNNNKVDSRDSIRFRQQRQQQRTILLTSPQQLREWLLFKNNISTTNNNNSSPPKKMHRHPSHILSAREATIAKTSGGCGISMQLQFDDIDNITTEDDNYEYDNKEENKKNDNDNKDNKDNNNMTTMIIKKQQQKTFFKSQFANDIYHTSAESHLREIMASYFDELFNFNVVIPCVGYRFTLPTTKKMKKKKKKNLTSSDDDDDDPISDIDYIRNKYRCVGNESSSSLQDDDDDGFYIDGSLMIWKDGISNTDIRKQEILDFATTRNNEKTKKRMTAIQLQQLPRRIDNAVRYVIFTYLGGCIKSKSNYFVLHKDNISKKEYVAIDNDRCFIPNNAHNDKRNKRLELYKKFPHNTTSKYWETDWDTHALQLIPCSNIPSSISERIFQLVSLTTTTTTTLSNEINGTASTAAAAAAAAATTTTNRVGGISEEEKGDDDEDEDGPGVTRQQYSSMVSFEFKKMLKEDILGDQMLNYQPEIFKEIDNRVLLFFDRLLQCQKEKEKQKDSIGGGIINLIN